MFINLAFSVAALVEEGLEKVIEKPTFWLEVHLRELREKP